MKVKRLLLIAGMLLLARLSISQVIISPYLMAQNGWRPYQVGRGTNPHDTIQCPGQKQDAHTIAGNRAIFYSILLNYF